MSLAAHAQRPARPPVVRSLVAPRTAGRGSAAAASTRNATDSTSASSNFQCTGGDPDADPGTRLDQALRGQRLDRLADHRAADTQLRLEVGLPRKRVVRADEPLTSVRRAAPTTWRNKFRLPAMPKSAARAAPSVIETRRACRRAAHRWRSWIVAAKRDHLLAPCLGDGGPGNQRRRRCGSGPRHR